MKELLKWILAALIVMALIAIEQEIRSKRSKLMKTLLKYALVALIVIMVLIVIVEAVTFVLVTRQPLF